MTHWRNFGDVSPGYGQTWIAPGGDDYARIVSVLSGSEIGLADNQYVIERGSIYFSPQEWNSALDCCGMDIIGPPEYAEIAYAFNAYMGFDRDIWGGFQIVQVGKKPDYWTAAGTTCEDPDVILHGNANISRYLEAEFLT